MEAQMAKNLRVGNVDYFACQHCEFRRKSFESFWNHFNFMHGFISIGGGLTAVERARLDEYWATRKGNSPNLTETAIYNLKNA